MQLHAQAIDSLVDKLADRIEDYGLQKSPATLFVHFDKNIYTPNENVWFTGYLLKNTDASAQDYAMAVALVRNADRSVLAMGKFIIDKNVSFGNIFLPDSLPTGNYTLIAYTNVLLNGYPRNVFMQPVSIKSAETKIVASLQLIDSVKTGIDSVRVLLNARTKDIRMISDAHVKYWLGDSVSHPLNGQINTDRKGDAFIMVPVKLLTQDNFMLTAQLQYGKETKTLRLRLPVYKGRRIIKFYPEGGNIINGLKNNIGFEVTSAEGDPIAVTAGLYSNNKAIQNIRTDVFGIGKFEVDANIQNSYSIKIVSGNDTDQYELPAILPSGTVIKVPDVLADDTLFTQLTNTYSGRLTVLLHDYKKIFASSEITVLTHTTLNVIFALTDIPRGLAEVTVLDSAGRPLAERIFFAHYNRKLLLNAATDSSEYSKRGKVQVKIKLSQQNGEPVNGMVSFACVQDNRLDVRKMMDIESYVYLTSELWRLPFVKGPMENEAGNRKYLNDILLVKGWRKYNWAALSAALPDTLLRKPSLEFTGNIIPMFKKKIQQPMQVGLLKNGGVSTIDADSSGKFYLTPEQTISDTTRNTVFVMGRDQTTHMVHINDPYIEMNKKLAAKIVFNIDPLTVTEPNTQLLSLKDDEFAHVLPTVVVQNNAHDYTIYEGRCSDYVCLYNILNCRNHLFGGSRPFNGETYRTMTGAFVVYKGNCGTDKTTAHFLPWAGISASKEFYGSDYSKFSPADPEYLSTIYWSHSVSIRDGEAILTFYTGDIAGRFRIIVQGTAGDNVISADNSFVVKAK